MIGSFNDPSTRARLTNSQSLTPNEERPPPMSVIVIAGTPPSSSHSLVSTSLSSTCFRPAQGAFRLQPRHPVKGTPSPSSTCRGRKRGAQMMSTPATVASTTAPEPASPDPSATVMGLQGLSLQSPRQRLQPPSMLESPPLSGPFSSFSRYTPSIGSPTHGSIQSHGSLSLKSHSPRRARCTVLKSTPTKRPPLHTSMASLMHSLDGSAGLESPTSAEPPSTVHCEPQSTPSSDSSLSTHQAQDGGPSMLVKLPRTDMAESPGSRRSMASMSPTSTPLPRLTLTPRSSCSKRSQDAPLPAFPSTYTNRKARAESYIPFPDWGEPATSLLEPPAPNDALERLIAAGGNNDGDSLSASDDEEAFFLATPATIHEERQCHQVKQRKLAPGRLSMASLGSSALASNTSLRGMNFVTSSTSLRGMDDKDCSKPPSNCVAGILREESQVSIGLNLESSHPTEAKETTERDLVTPPVMTQAKSPPPLSPRFNQKPLSSSDRDDGEDMFYYPCSNAWLQSREADLSGPPRVVFAPDRSPSLSA